MKKRFISFLLAVVMVIGAIPITATANQLDSSVIEESVSELGSTELPPMISFRSASSGNPGDEPGSDKMDDAYLEISFEKYGNTISATSNISREVSVLEYTQWQMSARFIRIQKGQVVEDKDVTGECFWNSSDITGTILNVTSDGLVTAHGACSENYSITANYECIISVPGADGTTDYDTVELTACITFNITSLSFSLSQEQELKSLALLYLVQYEDSVLNLYTGQTVAEMIAENQEYILNLGDSSVFENSTTTSPLQKTGMVYPNSPTILHFLSAVAGSCRILQSEIVFPTNDYMQQGISARVFNDGNDEFLIYYGEDIKDNQSKAERFAKEEVNGNRKTYLLGAVDYDFFYAPIFQSGEKLFNTLKCDPEHTIVIGEYFLGTVAKYVSYVTGCRSVTFNSPSPFQYVFFTNFSELCQYYSVTKQQNYVFTDINKRSAIYSIEPANVIKRQHNTALEYLHCTNDFVSIENIFKEMDPLVRAWNRNVYLGTDASDTYINTERKLSGNAVFGGKRSDEFRLSYAWDKILDPDIVANTDADRLASEIAGEAFEQFLELKQKAGFVSTVKAANILGYIVEFSTWGIFDYNLFVGGESQDEIYASVGDVFVHTKGDSPAYQDVYHIVGGVNRFYLNGYSGKPNITYKLSEDKDTLFVYINYDEMIEIDLSNSIFLCKLDFFVGDPFENQKLIKSISAPFEDEPFKLDAFFQIACPVDVEILDEIGNVVLTLKDGEEYFTSTDYGIFGVSYDGDEYVKTVYLFRDDYQIRIRGIENGVMKYTTINSCEKIEETQYCSLENIPVSEGAVYYVSNDLTECILSVDTDADGTVDDTVSFETTAAFAQKSLELSFGTSTQLDLTVTTTSADVECYWVSSDENVATVNDDGLVTATGFGNATILAYVADGSDAYATCTVTVPEESLTAENFSVTGLESAYNYTGMAMDIQLDVTFREQYLIQDIDYTVSFSELIEPGKATLTITGINNYTGTKVIEYEILEPKEPETVEEKVDWIVAKCRAEGWTDDWEIALWLHDWLVYNANYDYTYTYYSPYGVLLAGTGVCQSYADAYSLLLDEFEIENQVISSAEMNHAWNLVKLDGQWCHIDCTWDDPGVGGQENYVYFGMNDALMLRDHYWPTFAYPVSSSKANYYFVRRATNVAQTKEEAEAVFDSFAREQRESFDCYYIGDDANFSIFDVFAEWWMKNDWKYGLAGYNISGSEWMIQVEVAYTDPWEEPSGSTESTVCPLFTLHGPEGTYPVNKYSQNGLMLIFGRESCGNTQALLRTLENHTAALEKRGIQVLISMEGTFVPEDMKAIRSAYPSFSYVYDDGILMSQLLSAVGDTCVWITYPLIFIIDQDMQITYYSSGYVEHVDELVNKANVAGTENPLPIPDPVDPDYYGNFFNYTGNDSALAKMISEKLEAKTTSIVARDGTWHGTAEWDSTILGEAMMKILNQYREESDKYDIPYGWTYYSSMNVIQIDIGYYEQPAEPEPTEPEATEPEETKPTGPEETKPTEPTEPDTPLNPNGTVTRLAGSSRYETSIAIANEMKNVLGDEKFESIVLANSDSFADALAGSYLAAMKQAPIIIGKLKYADIVCDYVNNNLKENGTVYVLGGEGAMPEAMLSSITVTENIQRLAGNDRYATNLAILTEAGVAGKDILMATGQDFADSLSASATGLPILLVNGKPGKTLSDAQKDFLASVDGKIYIIGGESAVPTSMVDQIEAASGKNTERIAGNSRYETSVKIAEKFLGGAESAVVAYASTFPDGLCGGPLAYAVKAPLILTKDGKSEVLDYTEANAITSGYVLGGDGLISDDFAKSVFGVNQILK